MDVLSTDNPLDTSDCNTNHLETKTLIETNSFADVAGYHTRLCFNSYLMNTLRPNPYKENKSLVKQTGLQPKNTEDRNIFDMSRVPYVFCGSEPNQAGIKETIAQHMHRLNPCN